MLQTYQNNASSKHVLSALGPILSGSGIHGLSRRDSLRRKDPKAKRTTYHSLELGSFLPPGLAVLIPQEPS